MFDNALNYVLELFSAAQFVPHAVCLLWRPDLLWMHGLSDLFISLAYLAIPLTIIKAVHARPDLLDPKVARLFAVFITACALSHLSALMTLWVPAYGLQGVIKVITAAVSIFTAIQLARLLPAFLTMPSREELAQKEADVRVERRMREEAQEVRDKLSEFAHVASHDLKAPLRGISNQARFLQEDHGEFLAPDAKKRLDRIKVLCAQMEGIISTLLRYSQIGKTAASVDVRMHEVVDQIRSTLAETIEDKGAKIVVTTRLPDVYGDPSEVTTVFSNLIVNGLKYNDSDTVRLEIGFEDAVSVNGSTLRNVYYVRDNGIGIDPEFHDDVFRMFKRLHHHEAYGGGDGAGLAFVKRVIENSGGCISLVSSLGNGSTFYFSFGSDEEEQVPAQSSQTGSLGYV